MLTQPNTGFVTLHGNQLEQLREAVLEWVRTNPLDPLEQEIFLVQSNGVAEWLKIALAQELGVCAATQVTLPARFLWQAYRQALGPDAVAQRSPFDRTPLTWRLMHLLPDLARRDGFEPLRHFLDDGDPGRRLQLAQRLSDLMDQYQVYRADWLKDWEEGRFDTRTPQGGAIPLAHDQRWQALLWSEIMNSAPQQSRDSRRADIHARFVQAMLSGAAPAGRLPRRVILFGISALPYQTLQALAALSTRLQVIVAVPNPCQYYWGDIIDGRELLRAQHRRQPLRSGTELRDMPLQDLHAHSHPLLASWGRLGRDFIRMLDEFDQTEAARQQLSSLRVDLFSTGEGDTLLGQVQAAVRDMLPLHEHRRQCPDARDRSIEFHVAHSAQREIEVLHDRLLTLLDEDGGAPLRPRDIVVMVPDIETFSPAIRAVFGQYGDSDNRYIPYAIADIKERRVNPLLVSLDWLLHLPGQRCLQSEIRDLLDVPAIAARFGVEPGDLPRLAQWIEGAGIRWGLDGKHRDSIGLGQSGEQNAWVFGLRRMLLGYASGEGMDYAGIEPYAEVAGLDAELAGALASLLNQLLQWRIVLAGEATPAGWGAHVRRLLADFYRQVDASDGITLARLEQSLQEWLADCDIGGFNEPVPVAVLREAWLESLDDDLLNQRFVSGGVTFCTLLPMRAVPYRMVCLVGMNDGDFPRRLQRADFDLLAIPGLARPGDRSRRDDDRYLMLEAVLSARDKLYVSWVGKNVRDNSELPPSVLVAQLRDYLVAGWNLSLGALTTEHPLQPFSRCYFEGRGPTTYAKEWRAAHTSTEAGQAPAIPPLPDESQGALRLSGLVQFLRQPVKYFFEKRLRVRFDDAVLESSDEEPFAIDALQSYQLASSMLDDAGETDPEMDAETFLRARAARIAREGLLPIGLIGLQLQDEMVADLLGARQSLLKLRQRYAMPAEKLRVSIAHQAVRLDDWIDTLRTDGAATVWIEQNAGRIVAPAKGGAAVRPDKLIHAWVRQLALAAAGHPVGGYIVGRDAIVEMDPLEPAPAEVALSALLTFWREGIERPLPVACKTALALVAGNDPRTVYNGGYGDRPFPESNDACLARLWPDFDDMAAEPDWPTYAEKLYLPLQQWSTTHVRVLSFDSLLSDKEAA